MPRNDTRASTLSPDHPDCACLQTNHPWIVVFLVKPSDELKHAHLVMMLFNMVLAELCFFLIFYGYENSAGQSAVAVVIDEGGKWLMLLGFQWLFRWAMAEPELKTIEPEDDLGWHLVFRQSAPFAWPRGKANLCEFDHLADNFSKLDDLEYFRNPEGELELKLEWPGSARPAAEWAQTSNPLSDAVASGVRIIRAKSGRCVPLVKSPEPDKALIVGGKPADGEGNYYAIGHRLLALKRGTSGSSAGGTSGTRSRLGTLSGLTASSRPLPASTSTVLVDPAAMESAVALPPARSTDADVVLGEEAACTSAKAQDESVEVLRKSPRVRFVDVPTETKMSDAGSSRPGTPPALSTRKPLISPLDTSVTSTSRSTSVSTSAALDVEAEEAPRRPAHKVTDFLHRSQLPPPVVELYVKNPLHVAGDTAPSCFTRLRQKAAEAAARRQRQLDTHSAAQRLAPLPYKKEVMLQQQKGAQRAQVSVHAEWLLQYPDGRVAFFALSPTPGEPPLWVPVLRLHRQRESWMNLRLNRRFATGAGEGLMRRPAVMDRQAGKELIAEYELARADGRRLHSPDIVRQPLALHDQLGSLKRQAMRRSMDSEQLAQELGAIVQRVPPSYRSVGVRVYNPSKPKWKIQIAWSLQLLTCAFLIFLFISILATYWTHIESSGVNEFVYACE